MKIKVWVLDPIDKEGFCAEWAELIDTNITIDNMNRKCVTVKLADSTELKTPIFRVEYMDAVSGLTSLLKYPKFKEA